MSPLDRKIALMQHRKPLSEIARELEVSPSHVSQVLAGKRRSPRVEQAVATAIGRPLDEVFPPQGDDGDSTAGRLAEAAAVARAS